MALVKFTPIGKTKESVEVNPRFVSALVPQYNYKFGHYTEIHIRTKVLYVRGHKDTVSRLLKEGAVDA